MNQPNKNDLSMRLSHLRSYDCKFTWTKGIRNKNSRSTSIILNKPPFIQKIQLIDFDIKILLSCHDADVLLFLCFSCIP